MTSLLPIALTLLASTYVTPASSLSCHVCRSEPSAGTAPATANSTLGLILTLALHVPPDCDGFNAGEERYRTECPAGLDSTCATAEDAAGRRVKTCFGAAGGATGCHSDAAGTFCLCRSDLCNTAGDGRGSLTAVLVLTVTTVVTMW